MAVSLSDDLPPSNGPICPVCFRDYSDSEANLIPRILQCGHTYCTECLDRLLNTGQDEDDFEQVVLQIRYGGREWTTVRRQPLLSRTFATNDLKCPTCNSMNYITNRDVHTLTKNFALLGCRLTNQNQSRHQSTSKHFCTEHNHEKRVYCKDCRDLVCAYCQLYGDHKDHDCAIASDAAQPSVEALRAGMEAVTSHLSELSVGEKAVNKAERRLKRNRHHCEKQVKGYFDQLIRSLELKRNTLLMNIGSWTDEQMYILNAQLQSLASAIGDSENLQKTCDSLIKGDPLDALSQQDDVIKEITALRSRIAGLALQPLINPWIKCEVNEVPSDVLSDLLKNCTLTYDTDTQSGDDTMGSDLDRDYDSMSGDDILSSSDREDGVHQNRLTQEGAGASASPATKGKKKYYQETQVMSRWSPFGSDGSSLMPTLDPPDYPTWPLKQQFSNQTTNQPPTTHGAFPSPPNNSFLSPNEMPTSQGSDPNSMFRNPISTKAKYTNLLHTHTRLTTLSDVDSVSNSEDEDIRMQLPALPRVSLDNLSSSDSHHSDDENDSSLLNMSSILGSPYVAAPQGRHTRFLRSMLNRSVSIGERSASPDEDVLEGEERVTAGEIYQLPPGVEPVPRNSTCQSPDQEDFTYTHHLSRMHSETDQSNEIVIPLRHSYSWTGMSPRVIRAGPGSNRSHTMAHDTSGLGGNSSTELTVGAEAREDGGDTAEPPEAD